MFSLDYPGLLCGQDPGLTRLKAVLRVSICSWNAGLAYVQSFVFFWFLVENSDLMVEKLILCLCLTLTSKAAVVPTHSSQGEFCFSLETGRAWWTTLTF